MLVPYSAEQMYQLVDRIEDYPNFLPWCGGIDVHEHTETILDATLHIHFLGIKSKFRTRDLLGDNRIDISLVDGPFRSLIGHWVFLPLAADACKIEFSLEYDFSSTMLEKIIGPVFEKISKSFADSFIAEAERRYS